MPLINASWSPGERMGATDPTQALQADPPLPEEHGVSSSIMVLADPGFSPARDGCWRRVSLNMGLRHTSLGSSVWGDNVPKSQQGRDQRYHLTHSGFSTQARVNTNASWLLYLRQGLEPAHLSGLTG